MNQQSNQNKIMFNFSLILLHLILIIAKSDSITLDGLEALLSGSSTIKGSNSDKDERAMNIDSQECASLPDFMTGKLRIVAGHIAPKPIPWIVSLWTPDYPEQHSFCTGTILDKLTILTAKHCILEHPKRNGTLRRIMIRAGSTKIQAGTNVLVERVIFADGSMWDESINTRTETDLAVLKLTTPLSFDEKTKPLCLPSRKINFEYGLECFIGGWGISDLPNKSTKVLRWGKNRVFDGHLCHQLHNNNTNPNVVCSSPHDSLHSSACPGDSGSSLICMQDSKPVLAGVASQATVKQCGTRNSIAIFTKIVPYLSWIKQCMEPLENDLHGGETKKESMVRTFELNKGPGLFDYQSKDKSTVQKSCSSMLPASMRNIGRVLGGEVKNEPIPWQVSIGQRIGGYGDYEHICGGAILDMHTVITAAQCIAFRNTYEMFVLAGTSSLNTTIKPIQIQETLINLEHVYDFLTLEHDIVVIKTKEPLNQNNMKVEPICLPSSNKPVTEGSQCFVSGWGKMSKQRYYIPTQLNVGKVSVMNIEQCDKEFKTLRRGMRPRNIARNRICTNSIGKGACKEDLGGPLVCLEGGKRPVLSGIVSFGESCDQWDDPDVHTNVASYLSWIKQHLEAVQESSEEVTTEEPFTTMTSTLPVSTSAETTSAPTTAGITSLPTTTSTTISSFSSKPSTDSSTTPTGYTTSTIYVSTDTPIDSKHSKCDHKLPDFMRVPKSARISFGKTARRPIPWHVGIGYGSGMHMEYLCGGAILDSRTIISAASCYNESLADNLFILAGTVSVDSPTAQYEIESVKSYGDMPYAHHSFKDNIVIYKLKHALPFSKNIRKICLPSNDVDMSKIKTCWISGWGEVKNSIDPSSVNYNPTILQWGEVPLWKNDECQEKHTNTSLSPLQLTHKLVCAGTNMPHHINQDFCEGDQGGPLVCSMGGPNHVVLVGIITEFVNCGKFLPGLYTNIVPYLSWISRHMEGGMEAAIQETTKKPDLFEDDFFVKWFDNFNHNK